jgi:hypothetical protein
VYEDNQQEITVYCKLLSQHTAGGNEENHKKSAMDTMLPIKHLLNASQKLYSSNQLSGGINLYGITMSTGHQLLDEMPSS